MTFTWNDYIRFAEFLLADSSVAHGHSEEACARTAISRAYYGVYGQAWKVVEAEGVHLQSCGIDHYLVRRHLLRHPNSALRRAGYYLKQLSSQRIKADYDMHSYQTRQAAVDVVTMAQRAARCLREW